MKRNYLYQCLLITILLGNPTIIMPMEQPDAIQENECGICLENKEAHELVKLICNNEICVNCVNDYSGRAECPFCTVAWNVNARDHFIPHAPAEEPVVAVEEAAPVQPAPIDWQQNFQHDFVLNDDILRQLGILDSPSGSNNNNEPRIQPIPNFNIAAPAPVPTKSRIKYRAKPPVKGRNPFLVTFGVGVVASALAGTMYGCYKLYHYIVAPKPHVRKDVKAALAELHREADRCKQEAGNGNYVLDSLKAFYTIQEKAGSFESLTIHYREVLATRVAALDDALSKNEAIEEKYTAFTRSVSGLLQVVNNPDAAPEIVPASASTVMPAPVVQQADEMPVKTVVKPAPTKKSKGKGKAKRAKKK